MNQIHFGDCRTILRELATAGVKVQMCVTSPPYFGLRDYGVDGQLGLEETPEQYIAAMVEVFRAVRDVLADDGTLWINIGDSYATGTTASRQQGTRGLGAATQAAQDAVPRIGTPTGCKTKDLIGIPWMLAFALRADGWYLRQDIIWHKPNPMPESVTDRCTKAHEYLFLLSKSPRYYYDNEAIKEVSVSAGRTPCGNNKVDASRNDAGRDMTVPVADIRNRRSVWTIATKPYKGAHFAVFPPTLIEPCILAGTSAKGHCPACGARWQRVLGDPVTVAGRSSGNKGRQPRPDAPTAHSGEQAGHIPYVPTVCETVGWVPSCVCGCGSVPDIVLDPFMGSGTTAAVAVQHGRQYLGCELNAAYQPLQEQRIGAARTPQRDLFKEPA